VDTSRALESTIAQLADSQNTLAAVLDSTANGMFFVGPQGTVLYANRRAGELLGIDPRQAVGRKKLDLVASELQGRMADPQRFSERLRAIYAEPEATAVDEIEVLRPVRRILERYSGPVYRQDGTLLGRIDVYTDMTEIRDLQRNKDEFLSLVSHELKTPITSIKGYIQLLRKRAERESPSRRTLVAYEVIERQTQRMQTLIDMLLDLSRLESGRLTLQRTPVELRALLDETVSSARTMTNDHEIAVALPPRQVWVEADAPRLEQVITNLLTNAIRYSPNGEPIKVELSRRGKEAHIRVRDHGTGIAPDALPRVFERFFRAGSNPHQGGMGIGLYVANGIVTEHGGRIDVTSELGRGSTFTVVLPSPAPA
jgi:PAS domain S-box-containing protein